MLLASVSSAADAPVEIVTQRNETISGQLTKWTADQIAVQSNTPRLVSPDDIFSLHFPEHHIKPAEGDAIILASGDRVAGSVLRVRDEMIEAGWTIAPLRPHWNGALESVAALAFNLPAAPRIRREWLEAIEHVPPGSDQVQFITGERLPGEFLQLDGQQIDIKASFGMTQLDRQRVRWICLDPDLQTKPKIPSPCWFVWLTDGSRLTATDLQPGGNLDVQLTLLVGGKFTIARHQVARLQRFDDRLLPLSRRTPTASTYTPYLSGKKSLRADRNVLGSPITVRGVESAVGLGMTSAMTATYRVEPGDRAFRTSVGIDDAAEGRGSARFRVLLDGKAVWESQEITGQMALVTVPPVSLAGAKELTLAVDFGNAGDVGDVADWCDALIVRDKAASASER